MSASRGASNTLHPPGGHRVGYTDQRLADAEAKLRRFQDAIAAGIDPSALVEAMNEAQEKRAAAQAELNGVPKRVGRSAAEIHAMIDSLGDVKKVIRQADPDELQRLYEALNVEIIYNATGRMRASGPLVGIKPVSEGDLSLHGWQACAVCVFMWLWIARRQTGGPVESIWVRGEIADNIEVGWNGSFGTRPNLDSWFMTGPVGSRRRSVLFSPTPVSTS